MGAPYIYIYDISRLRVKSTLFLGGGRGAAERSERLICLGPGLTL